MANTAMRLEGKTAVVTGGGQGVGRGIALAFARAGASVAIIDVNRDAAVQVCAEVEEIGSRAVFVRCDVRERTQVNAAVDEVVRVFGGVDILVNNAQQAPAAPVALMDHDDDLVDLCFNSGYRGTLYFMQAAYPHLKESQGKVINLGSAAGLDGMIGYAAYGATKEAIRALSKTAAREWGRDGINVNILCPLARSPGIEDFLREAPEMEKRLTAGHPIARIGDCETDIGPVAVFLASEDARYLTGMTVPADGGALMIR
jgi:NAD(P)-dependent dehydrogenase (short-subunit alcohol dehydrogenase family)